MRDYEFYYTQDGSIGLYSYADDDVYHSKFGALSEAWEKFILPAQIDKKLNNQDEIRVLDVCYGIGYNTKAFMSFVINSDEKFLKQKNILKKFLEKFLKIINSTLNIVSIGINKTFGKQLKLLLPLETINNKLSKISIDCLEINDELVKISPLLKSVGRRKKNKKEITELLDLKFNNDYDCINKKYKLHKYVNLILANAISEYYKTDYLTKELQENINNKSKKQFFDKFMLRYVKFLQNSRYNLWSVCNLSTFLHNIYYGYLSKRYKNIDFKRIDGLFKLSFHVKDARKTILEIKGDYDYILLDAFTYSKAPELWSLEFIAEIYQHLSDNGIIMTYSNSALVRNTFLENNLYVGKILDNKTGKFIGTVASKNKQLIEHPLTNFEIGLCATKAGIPYHDPGLNLDKKEILKRREHEFKTSELISSSLYMKSRKNRKEDDEE